MPGRRGRCGAVLVAAFVALAALGCAEEPEPEGPTRAEIEAAVERRTARVLERATDRIAERANAIYQRLREVSLLDASDRAALRRYLQPQHLAAARRLGVGPVTDSAEMAELRREGRLVELEDSTEYWIVREVGDPTALVTPDARALLREIGRRFQARLQEMGLPPYRIELSSLLRTAVEQAALRETNVNAAEGVSTHQFGTTVDILYESYAAPAEPVIEFDLEAMPRLEPHLRRIARVMLERIAARKSRELQAILGDVLRELQAEGKVLVTLERQQPVYHITVAERLAGGS